MSVDDKKPIPLPPDIAAAVVCLCRDAGRKADAARKRADQARKQGLMQKVQRYQGEAKAYDWICARLNADFEDPEIPW